MSNVPAVLQNATNLMNEKVCIFLYEIVNTLVDTQDELF